MGIPQGVPAGAKPRPLTEIPFALYDPLKQSLVAEYFWQIAKEQGLLTTAGGSVFPAVPSEPGEASVLGYLRHRVDPTVPDLTPRDIASHLDALAAEGWEAGGIRQRLDLRRFRSAPKPPAVTPSSPVTTTEPTNRAMFDGAGGPVSSTDESRAEGRSGLGTDTTGDAWLTRLGGPPAKREGNGHSTGFARLLDIATEVRRRKEDGASWLEAVQEVAVQMHLTFDETRAAVRIAEKLWGKE